MLRDFAPWIPVTRPVAWRVWAGDVRGPAFPCWLSQWDTFDFPSFSVGFVLSVLILTFTTSVILVYYDRKTQQAFGEGLTQALETKAGQTFETTGYAQWDPTSINTEGQNPLTDEEHVLRMLIANDGSIQQSRLVEETGWSKSKASRVLRRMEHAGDITRVRWGHSNLVFLGRRRETGP